MLINYRARPGLQRPPSRAGYLNVRPQIRESQVFIARCLFLWLLLTSAYHMKRSDVIFNSNGWEVIPYPAGYLTRRDYRLIPNFEVLENMFKLQIAVKEMIGIMAYTLTGKIKSNEVTNSSPMPAARDAVRDSGATAH